MIRIPFLSLEFQHQQVKEDVRDAFESVYNRSRFILDQEVSGFEHEYADYCGVPFALGVGNGLDALTLALMAQSLPPDTDIIVPAHTYFATWLAVSRANCRIVPVDADENTFNIDVSKIAGNITPRTRIILPVHMYGQPCDMTEIQLLAQRFNLTVIEDNAQAHGATWLQKRTGSFGTINATSFYPTKNLGGFGDGGALTFFDARHGDSLRRLRNYGMESRDHFTDLGVNSRLDEIQAAFLRVKLRRLDEWNATRRELAARYLENLSGVPEIVVPRSSKEAQHVYHLFVILTEQRDRLKKHLEACGIETMVHYSVPCHLQPAFAGLGFSNGDFPVAELIARNCLSLPLWPGMSADQVDYVSEKIQQLFR